MTISPSAGKRECPVDRQARVAACVARWPCRGHQRRAQSVNTLAAERRDRYHRRPGKRGVCEQGAQRCGHIGDTVRRKVGLGQCHDSTINAQQGEDLKVLAGLPADALGQRHDQQSGIDAAGASEHGVHETLMAGNVDEAELSGVGVAEVNRDAAPLFLRQAVGVDARQRFDQRCLAVIDVAGGTDDHAGSPVAGLRVARRDGVSSLAGSPVNGHPVRADRRCVPLIVRTHGLAPEGQLERTLLAPVAVLALRSPK